MRATDEVHQKPKLDSCLESVEKHPLASVRIAKQLPC